MCSFLAKMRHGPESKLAFVCTEFLLPDERERFLEGGGLPKQTKKCLMCTRYYQSAHYFQLRNGLRGLNNASLLQLQTFTNSTSIDFDGSPEENTHTAQTAHTAHTASCAPQSASEALSDDGYLPSAMLFVDEGFIDLPQGRDGPDSAFFWRPVVKFSTQHYAYRLDEHGAPFVVQVGIGARDRSLTSSVHFGQPPSKSDRSEGGGSPSGADPN